MLENLYLPLLYMHIAAGGSALLTGLLSIVTTKGGKIHTRSGTVFFAAMILVSFTAFGISILKDNKFLFAIGIFSFYMNYTGYRALKNNELKYAWYDWLVVTFASAAALFMISTFNTVLVFLGTIQAYLLVRNTSVQFQKEEKRKEIRKKRILLHLGNMMGTYIATFTAFIVVNVNFVKPVWLIWLLPTIFGVPVIIYYNQVWKKKLGE